MTIETTANRISYTGSGTTGPFSFPYYFLADGDLTVIKTTIADGTEETLTITTDYTVSGAGEAAGGSVTLVATLSSTYKLTIIRDPDILQPADYPANDRFPAATHEEALDRATMILQRLKDLIDRAFRLSDGDVSGISLILSNLSAGNLIAVNSAGDGIESIAAADVDLATVSAFILTLLDDANAADARTTLGAASLAANTFTGIQRWAKGADVASANALALGTDGNYFDITGTTTITSIGTLGVGTVVKLHFDAALTLTHHATDLILPGGANITTAAGDEAEFVEYATGDWRCTNYVPAAFVPAVIGQAEAEAGTDTSPRLWTAERVAQAIAALAASGGSLPKNYITGLTLSNNASDATNDIDIAIGSARDSTNAEDIVLASALTKQLDAAWAVGTNQGGLDTGSIANTTYYVWLIMRSDTSVVDVLFSASPTAPTMPTNYDYKRRIGAIIRESAAIVGFVQSGIEFVRKVPINSVNASGVATTAVTRTLNTPVGIKTRALIGVCVYIPSGATSTSNTAYGIMTDLATTDTAPSATINHVSGRAYSDGAGNGEYAGSSEVRVVTNTSSQIRSRVVSTSTAPTLTITTIGWDDYQLLVGE